MPEVPTSPVVSTGTRLRANLDGTIHGTSRPGDSFSATLREPASDMLGNPILPAGAKVLGRVVDPAALPAAAALTIDSIDSTGVTKPLNARVVEVDTRLTKASFEGLVGTVTVLGAMVSGAVIGGAWTGDVDGSVRGAVVASGTAAPQTSPPARQSLPAGTVIVVETTARFEVAAQR